MERQNRPDTAAMLAWLFRWSLNALTWFASAMPDHAGSAPQACCSFPICHGCSGSCVRSCGVGMSPPKALRPVGEEGIGKRGPHDGGGCPQQLGAAQLDKTPGGHWREARMKKVMRASTLGSTVSQWECAGLLVTSSPRSLSIPSSGFLQKSSVVKLRWEN